MAVHTETNNNDPSSGFEPAIKARNVLSGCSTRRRKQTF